jgi:hypothetical protein
MKILEQELRDFWAVVSPGHCSQAAQIATSIPSFANSWPSAKIVP